MQAAVQSSLAEDAGKAFDQLSRHADFWKGGGAAFLMSLISQIEAQNRESDILLAASALSRLPAGAAEAAMPVIGALVNGRSRKGSAVARLADAGKLNELNKRLETLLTQAFKRAGDATLPPNERVAAIESLSLAPDADAIPALTSLINNRQPQEVQQAAITALGRYQHSGVARTLIRLWPRLSPRLRETASEVLFARTERVATLFDAVDAGDLELSDLTRTRLQAASKSKNVDLAKRAAAFLDKMSTGRRNDVLARYRAALSMNGDLARGRQAFKTHCSVCHKVEGVGHELGPNLATMKSRGPDAILANVIDPNAEVNPLYLNYIVLTEDGNTLTGMITAESATTITLTRAEGKQNARVAG